MKYLEISELNVWVKIPFTKCYFSKGSRASIFTKMGISQHFGMFITLSCFHLAQEAEKETELKEFALGILP